MAVCLLSLVAAPLGAPAQDRSDEVASTEAPEDRADSAHPADPSDQHTLFLGSDHDAHTDHANTDFSVDDVPALKAQPQRKYGLGVRVRDMRLDSDDTDRDDSDNDVDDGAPKRKPKQDTAKKEPPKKDAPKTDAKKGAAAATKKPGDCVDVSTEARFAGVGYDHLVTLKSDCKKPMQCVIRTNVNSEPASVALPAKGEQTVVTWRGSPSRVFTPDVTCN
jgi:hypothetical protein